MSRTTVEDELRELTEMANLPKPSKVRAEFADDFEMPQTFVDDAELVWKLAETGRTQDQIAKLVGWSRGQVSQYLMLKNICAEAWQIVSGAFEKRG